VSLGDLLLIDWDGTEERLEFQKEAEGALASSSWLAEILPNLASTHSTGRAITFPSTAAVTQ
jgi:hypothetical protein